MRPRTGSILVDGVSISGLPPREISRRGVVFVPQEANVFTSMTIEENLEIGAYIETPKLPERLAAIFKRIPELATRRRMKAGTLSGGQRQLLAMGMALMVAPKLMLLDEPTAGLSPAAAEDLFKMVRAISADGVSIAMVGAERIAGTDDCGSGLHSGRWPQRKMWAGAGDRGRPRDTAGVPRRPSKRLE